MTSNGFSRRSLLAAGAGLGLSLALPSVRAQSAKRHFKISTVAASNSPWHLGALAFKEEVERRSEGRFAVSVFPDGQLGDNNQLYAALQLGTLDFNYAGLSSALVLKGGEILNVLYVPYLFRDAESAQAAVNGAEFGAIYDRIAKASGVRPIGAWGHRSPRALQTTRGPIHQPDDVKGLRIRIPPYDILRATFENLDAQAVSLGWLELYTALSRGTVDGQENGFDISTPARFHEVAKHWSATDQTYESVGWFTSDRLWQSLSTDDKNLVAAAAEAAGLVTTRATQKVDEESIGILKASGAQYVEAFRKRLHGVHKRFDDKLWPAGFVEKVRTA
jgi:tripartite ATP-independent transporter DctP family solute receptor